MSELISASLPARPAGGGPDAAERALQRELLASVSRTFALTIPCLPAALVDVVSNTYLLCRAADTIEDELVAAAETKAALYDDLLSALDGAVDARRFAAALYRTLPADAPAGERRLAARLGELIDVSRRFTPTQRQAQRRCLQIMCEGMLSYQPTGRPGSVADLDALERYCYYVAGVVGETLTTLFCEYSPALAERRDELLALAVPFGNGLQLTNIVQDVWDDRRRGACWLPHELFGVEDIRGLLGGNPLGGSPLGGNTPASAHDGIGQLIALAHAHLGDALRYVLLIPPHEAGLRSFCLRPIGLAMLTLRKANRQRQTMPQQRVKITRAGVRAALWVSDRSVRYNGLLKTLFSAAGRGLPPATAFR